MKPPRRAIYSYVCGGLHSLDHAALTSFEHERAHYGARLSPFVPHSERRQLDMTTTSAVLSAYPLWSRLSTSVLSASPHFGRGQVRGAPCTESISTLVNPLSKLFRNCLKTEIESLKRISRVFERNGAFFSRYRARVREPRCSRSGRFGRSRPYESAPTSSRSQAWLFAPAQRR